MKARAVVSIAVVLGGGLLMGVLNAACSSTNETTGGSPGASGSGTTAGAPATGGGGAASGGAGGSAAGTAGMGTGGGLMMVGGKCPNNSVKRMDGLCYCQPSTLSACADGCGDFMTDPDHCGGCMTKCGAQQACGAGKCGSDPKVLVPAAAGCGSMHITVAGGNVYYTDEMHNTVSSVPVAGGTPKALSSTAKGPTLIKATATNLFWINGTEKSVMMSGLDGMNAMAVVPAQTEKIGGFTLSDDGKTVYVAAGKVVSKVATSGGALTEVGHEASGIPHALAVGGTFVAYPTEINGDVDVMVVTATPSICAGENDAPVVNKDCNRLARSQGAPNYDSIYIIGDAVYWANQNSIYTSSASKPTGFNDTIVQDPSPNANSITAFAINKNVVYFADDSGYVVSAPLMMMATATTLARGQMKPTSMAVDDANVYWANGDCSIVSLPLK